MSNIISFFQKLIKGGGVGIRVGGLENFSKINKRGGGTIIRYSRVLRRRKVIFSNRNPTMIVEECFASAPPSTFGNPIGEI